MNTSHLMTLALIAEHGSFTRAAEALNVSQPSISQQVRELERIVGLPLVVAHGRSLALTAVGRDLAAIGSRIAIERERANRTAQRHRDGIEGRLVVAASMTTGQYVVTRAIVDICRERPHAHIELRSGNSHDVAHAVSEDLADIGVIEGHIERDELVVTPFQEDELVCIARPGHDLAGRTVAPEDVSGERCLVREDGSGTRQVLLEALTSRGFKLARLVPFGTNDTIKVAVHLGLGIAWLSRAAVAAEVARGELARLTFATPPILRAFSVVRRRDLAPSPLGDVFIERLFAQGDLIKP